MRREAAVLDVGKSGFIGRHHARAGSGLDAHVAQRHAAFHGKRANGFAGVFDDVAGCAISPDLADDAKSKIFRGYPFGQRTTHVDQHGFRLALRQALRGQDMLDFRRADAEGQRPEGSMGAGVAVTANDCHARLRESQLGADYVHDALIGRVHVEQRNPKLLAIFLQRLDLAGGNRIGDGSAARLGRNIVVHRGDRPIWLPDLASGHAQAVESLRRSHLMDQMQVDIKQRQAVGWRCYDVLVPDFLE